MERFSHGLGWLVGTGEPAALGHAMQAAQRQDNLLTKCCPRVSPAKAALHVWCCRTQAAEERGRRGQRA